LLNKIKKRKKKKKDVLKTANKDYTIEVSKIDGDKSKYVGELKIDENEPQPAV